MTFLTKALDSRKRQQLYNFTITICHYDYQIMKLNCTMKLLVTLFSLFNMAIFGHIVSLWDTILRRDNCQECSAASVGRAQASRCRAAVDVPLCCFIYLSKNVTLIR